MLTAFAVTGVVLGAVYMLTLYMKTMFGELNEEKNGSLTDVTPREIVTFAPLFVLVFVMGIYPQPFLRLMEPTVHQYIEDVSRKMVKVGSPIEEPADGTSYAQKSGGNAARAQLAFESFNVERVKPVANSPLNFEENL